MADLLGFFAVATITGAYVDKKKILFEKLLEQYMVISFQNNYSQSIMQSIRSGVIAVNRQLLITALNNGAREILGTSRGLEGMSLGEVFPNHPDLLMRIQETLTATKAVKGLELPLITGDGRTKTLAVSLFPLIYDQVSRGAVLIFDDVTELKHLREHMLRNDKLAALGELSAGIAHEIRNPLAIIKAIEETMRRELVGHAEAVKQLEMIDEEVERANRVVNGLIDTAKPRRGVRKTLSLNEIVTEVLLMIDNYLGQHNVLADFQPGAAAPVLADAEQIKQVIDNLVFNSVQAMPEGGKLTISTGLADQTQVILVVSDSGKGIEPSSLPRVFDPFFTTKPKGTGLGLAVVHRIVDEHGGLISLSSEYGKGTRVEVVLPAFEEGSNIE